MAWLLSALQLVELLTYSVLQAAAPWWGSDRLTSILSAADLTLPCVCTCAVQPNGPSLLLMKQRRTQQQQALKTAATLQQGSAAAAASTGNSSSGTSVVSALRRHPIQGVSARQHARLWKQPSCGRKSGNVVGCTPAPAGEAAAAPTGIETATGTVTGLIEGMGVTAEVSGRTTAEIGAAGREAAGVIGNKTAAAETETAGGTMKAAETAIAETMIAAIEAGAANAASGTIEAAAVAGTAATGGKRAPAAGATQRHRCGKRMTQTAVGA